MQSTMFDNQLMQPPPQYAQPNYSVPGMPMNTHGMNDSYESRESPRGQRYYWLTGGGLDFKAIDEDSDVRTLLDGKIAVTPLHHDLNQRASLARWAEVVAGKLPAE